MVEEFLAYHVDHQCRPMDLTDNSDDGVPGEIAITAPVGINGRNLAADVQVIQQALNDVPPDQGRPVPSLKVDGICGEKTRKAIQMFQLKHFGWRLADGRVDPLKQTIAKLNELVGGAAPFISGPGTVRIAQRVARVPRIIGLLNRAFDCIRAARNNLILAQQVVDQADTPAPSIGASRAVKMEQVNRHFDVDTYPKPARHGVVHQLSRTFDMMLSVFTRPGGLWGKAIFDLDPLNKDYVAYTYPQGYHRSGVKKTEKGKELRIDSIYLCDGIDTVLDDECVLVIIHELSHFVAFPQRIGDFAYGWYDQPKMKRLVPWQKLHNAMNHCNFAWDAKYGHERKPQGLD